jgi:UTP--glucose-1-phosphate uridylyltransferase
MKAVIALAGYGTRFLPATKVVPKELLPVVDRPIAQYLVEEVVASGIEDIILVTRSGTQAIADHFDSSRELEVYLAERNKAEYLRIVQAIPRLARFAVVRQGRHLPYGNGTPLLAAKSFLTPGEPLVYMFGDDLVRSATPCVKQLLDVYHRHQPAAVIAFQEVPRPEIRHYAAARLVAGSDPPQVESLVEKPSPSEAPSTLAQLGRFVLPWRIIEILEGLPLGKDNELYLTVANDRLCKEARVLAHAIEGDWLTTGDPLRFLQANIQFGLHHPQIGPELARYLEELRGKGK